MNSNNNQISVSSYIFSLVIISLTVFLGLIFIAKLIADGLFLLASLFGAVVVFLSLVYLRRKFSPYRWLTLSVVFVLIFTIYPIISTFVISFTNMSGGHLMTQQQAVNRLEEKMYVPEGSPSFSWTAYSRNNEAFLLVLENEEGETFLAEPGKPLTLMEEPLSTYGDLDSAGELEVINGFTLMKNREVVPLIETLGKINFSLAERPINILSLSQATELYPRYRYDEANRSLIDQETGIEYLAVDGTYTSESGDQLVPGFKVNVGLQNYSRFVGNSGYWKPIFQTIIWNILFAVLSVLLSFLLGLLVALVFDNLPGKRIIQTLLLIPYPIPVLVSIIVWRGLLNDSMGLLTQLLQNLFGQSPHFFTDKNWTRLALILINVYLSYPYFYIIASGAIRSIPNEIYEAASIDGASSFARVKLITMPLVLRILMPLIIASFSFNFNNFTLIWGFNSGLPAIANTIVPMGYTDLLISFIYRLGFGTSNAANYGFAAAITVLLFILVAAMVFFQIRSTKALKEEK